MASKHLIQRNKVCFGRVDFTFREFRILKLVARGLKNKEVAPKVGLSYYTLKNYLGVIYEKTGHSDRVSLALWYERNSLLI